MDCEREKHIVAFIPVRGGSKGIPQKNIKDICGRPLVYWAIDAAVECDFVEHVYVSTDCPKIAEVVSQYRSDKVTVIGRPTETAIDTASTESAMIDFALRFQPEIIILIQATSPLITGKDLTNGINKYVDLNADSLVSVTRQKRFRWEVSDNYLAKPLNYLPQNRPRRQDHEGEFIENGAFYICNTKMLLETGSRLHGKTAASLMDEASLFEIDDETDWIIVESLLNRNKVNAQSKKRRSIKVFLTDVDGVLTDCGMYYSELGDEIKKFNTRDGVGLRKLQQNGIKVGIITGENTKIVENRAKKLNVDYLFQGCADKLSLVRNLASNIGVSFEEIAFIGDDVNDLELLKVVGCSACPADARPEVALVVTERLRCKGGGGAVREFAELILYSERQGVEI